MKKLIYYPGLIICLALNSNYLISQRPLTQIEGLVEIYDSLDSTSIYIGLESGKLAPASTSPLYLGATFLGTHAGKTNSFGFHNTLVGFQSGLNIINGDNNSFLGAFSGMNNLSSNNSFIGFKSGSQNISGGENSFFGYKAGESHNVGSYNTFLGSEAGQASLSGTNNTFVGSYAGNGSTIGSYNTFVGVESGYANKEGHRNTYLGYYSGERLQNGAANTFLGYQSGSQIAVGDSNIIVGSGAGPLGYGANTFKKLYIDIEPTDNPLIYGEFDNDLIRINGDLEIIGSIILKPINNGENSFYGAYAGVENNGFNNTFMGYRSGNNNATGSSNSFFGSNAGKVNTGGDFNTFIGNSAGVNNIFGYSNTFLGGGAGRQNNAGAFNTYVGNEAGSNITHGSKNLIIGSEAGPTNANNSISNNLFIDIETSDNPLIYGEFDNDLIRINGDLEVTGLVKTPVFDSTSIYLPDMTPDSVDQSLALSNVAIGYMAAHDVTNGSANISIGQGAGSSNSSGNANIYLGHKAGQHMTTANNNVVIGFLAGENVDGSGNVFIGNKSAQQTSPTPLNNRLYISNGPDALIYGEFDNKIARINGKLQVVEDDIVIRNIGETEDNTGVKWSENTNPVFGLVYDGEGIGVENRLHLREYLESNLDIMTYKVNGNVGIGVDNPQQNLDILGNIRIRGVGSTTSSNDIRIDALGNLTTSMSDIRLKENIEVIPDALDKISRLRGVAFTWKSDPTAGVQHGLIAQDVLKVAPELVFKKEGHLGVDYSEMIGILVESIKALKVENEILKSRITKIEQQ